MYTSVCIYVYLSVMGSVSHQPDKSQNHLGYRPLALSLREYILSITFIDVERPTKSWVGWFPGQWILDCVKERRQAEYVCMRSSLSSNCGHNVSSCGSFRLPRP